MDVWILIVLLILSLIIHLIFNSSFFYRKVKLQPIKIYYAVSTAKNINFNPNDSKNETVTLVSMFKQKYEIETVKFTIKNVFISSKGELEIKFNNFKQSEKFWVPMDDESYTWDVSKVEKYRETNVADYLVESTFFQDLNFPIWSQISNSQPCLLFKSMPFLKQTSYGIWEGDYFFSTHFDSKQFAGETYIAADAKKILFKIGLPEKYRIISDEMKVSKTSDGYIISYELSPGESFHITIVDQTKEKIKQIMGFSLPLFWIVIGMIIQMVFSKFSNTK